MSCKTKILPSAAVIYNTNKAEKKAIMKKGIASILAVILFLLQHDRECMLYSRHSKKRSCRSAFFVYSGQSGQTLRM